MKLWENGVCGNELNHKKWLEVTMKKSGNGAATFGPNIRLTVKTPCAECLQYFYLICLHVEITGCTKGKM